MGGVGEMGSGKMGSGLSVLSSGFPCSLFPDSHLTNTVVVAAGEIVKEKSGLTVGFKGSGSEAEAIGDRIGNDGKALTEFVDEAKN